MLCVVCVVGVVVKLWKNGKKNKGGSHREAKFSLSRVAGNGIFAPYRPFYM